MTKTLGRTLCGSLGQEQASPPDVMEHESAGVGCCSDVVSEGQCHTQAPCCQSCSHHIIPNKDEEVLMGDSFRGRKSSSVQTEFHVVCLHPLRYVHHWFQNLEMTECI